MPTAQRSFDDLGTPLADVTFAIVDLETTGGSPRTSAITEIGALKVRCGEIIGTYQTLVDPRVPIPSSIRMLTGISDRLLAGAPQIGAVLPPFLEFVRGCVLVAHNARFDVGFLNASLEREGYPPLDNRVVCTARLARKILAGEVANHKLATLAEQLRCAHRPEHRAFPDVLATTDVLHHLIERVAGFGVTTIEDLEAMTATRIDGTFSKIALARDVPPATGVYRFLSATGTTLYVGKATDLRTRVRSYFYGDPRRKIRDLMRETQEIRTEVHATMLEAEVAEARAIAAESPPYNRAGKRAGTWYLKVTITARTPRLHACRVPKDDGSAYLGPFVSSRAVRTLIDGLQDAFPVHRCTEPARCKGCAFSQMGTCSGTDPDEHRGHVHDLAGAISGAPDLAFDALARRMLRLALHERFEEAAELRDRAAALERAVQRRAEIEGLLSAGDILLRVGRRSLLLRDGQLAGAIDTTGADAASELEALRSNARTLPVATFLSAAVQREALVLCSWLRRPADDTRIAWIEGTWALPLAARPARRFLPVAEPSA